MVKLSEVTDEHFEEIQAGPIPSDNDDDYEEYSDTDSETSDHAHPHPHAHSHSHSPRSGGRATHSSHGPPPRSGAKKSGKQSSSSRGAKFAESDSDDDDEDDDDDDDEDGMTIEEGLAERLVALKDMIPIKQRTKMVNAVRGVWGWISWGARTGGNVAFVVSTGVLMLGVPYALAVAEETQMVEMEKEMKV